jgi:hypothetical protein
MLRPYWSAVLCLSHRFRPNTRRNLSQPSGLILRRSRTKSRMADEMLEILPRSNPNAAPNYHHQQISVFQAEYGKCRQKSEPRRVIPQHVVAAQRECRWFELEQPRPMFCENQEVFIKAARHCQPPPDLRSRRQTQSQRCQRSSLRCSH